MNSLSTEDANMLKLLTLRLEHRRLQEHGLVCEISALRCYERGHERGAYECLFEANLAAERCTDALTEIIKFTNKTWP